MLCGRHLSLFTPSVLVHSCAGGIYCRRHATLSAEYKLPPCMLLRGSCICRGGLCCWDPPRWQGMLTEVKHRASDLWS